MTINKKPKIPFWKDAAYITAIASILAIIIPGTAAINGLFNARVDYRRQIHEIRLQYLDRAIDLQKPPDYRKMVLGFLLDTLEPNDIMINWADKMNKSLIYASKREKEFEEIKRKLEDVKFEKEEIKKNLANEKNKLISREKELIKQIESLKKQLQSARLNLAEAEREAFIDAQFSKLRSFLKISSIPTGAQVFINGKDKGKTPLNIELPLKTYEVRLELRGYYNWEGQVQLESEGDLPLLVRLEPIENIDH